MLTNADDMKWKLKRRLVHFLYQHWMPKVHSVNREEMPPPAPPRLKRLSIPFKKRITMTDSRILRESVIVRKPPPPYIPKRAGHLETRTREDRLLEAPSNLHIYSPDCSPQGSVFRKEYSIIHSNQSHPRYAMYISKSRTGENVETTTIQVQ